MKLWEYFNRAHTAILASLLMISFTAACGDDEEEKENKDTETKETCQAKTASDPNKMWVWNENATGEKCTLQDDQESEISEDSSDVTYDETTSTLTYTAKTEKDKADLAGKNVMENVSVWVDTENITLNEDMTVTIEISDGQVKLTGLDGKTLSETLESKASGGLKQTVVHVSKEGKKDDTFLTFTTDALQFLAEKLGVDFGDEGVTKFGDTNKGQEAMIKAFQDAIKSDKFPVDNKTTEADA